jgi:hypothetical protein
LDLVSLKSKSPLPKPKFDYKPTDENASGPVIFSPIELKPIPMSFSGYFAYTNTIDTSKNS